MKFFTKNLKKVSLRSIYATTIILFPILLILALPYLFKEKIIIETITPEQIVAGVIFNPFEGAATLSIRGDGFTEEDSIYINNQPQPTAYGGSDWLTCTVDENHYAKPGQLKIQIKREVNGRIILKSNKKNLKIKSR